MGRVGTRRRLHLQVFTVRQAQTKCPRMKKNPLRLFHVEDDAGDRELFQMAVKKLMIPLHLTGATDGEEAFQSLSTAAENALPDVILLDLNLPKKDGRQLLAEAKRHNRLKLIPIVILTTSSAPVDIETCYANGAACYLVKPIDFQGLTALVKKLLEFWQEVEIPGRFGKPVPPEL